MLKSNPFLDLIFFLPMKIDLFSFNITGTRNLGEYIDLLTDIAVGVMTGPQDKHRLSFKLIYTHLQFNRDSMLLKPAFAKTRNP